MTKLEALFAVKEGWGYCWGAWPERMWWGECRKRKWVMTSGSGFVSTGGPRVEKIRFLIISVGLTTTWYWEKAMIFLSRIYIVDAYVVSCPTWTENIKRCLTWGAFKVGSMLCKSIALCIGLCNILCWGPLCFRIWLVVRIHIRRAWLVAWGLTEWTMVRWGTSSKPWTEVLHRGHEMFSKGTLSRCHSWNGKKI